MLGCYHDLVLPKVWGYFLLLIAVKSNEASRQNLIKQLHVTFYAVFKCSSRSLFSTFCQKVEDFNYLRTHC